MLLKAEGIRHLYGAVKALDDVGLEVHGGELLTILGPSGSGKTSLLRVLGGFEMPDKVVTLRIDGADMRGVPPHRRPVATVFQHYALFPHLSVGGNVEYGLRVRGVAKAERRRKAEQALELLHLPDKYARGIRQLSGGERQRVAFARALVTEPRILLLDEPMGALDERLRKTLEIEIRALQQKLGMTIVQVTHSRDEALSMSDRIAVMNRGRIEQVGTPADIFERPATRFIAEFMGLTNIFAGRIDRIERPQVRIDCMGTSFYGPWTGPAPPSLGETAFIAVHPERLRPGITETAGNTLDGRVTGTSYQGMRRLVELETGLGPLTISLAQGEDIAAATSVHWFAGHGAIGPLHKEIPNDRL